MIDAIVCNDRHCAGVTGSGSPDVADPKGCNRSRVISLDLLGGHVWTWEKEITGRCGGLHESISINVLVNGEITVAERNGETFSATVRLQPGENIVQAAVGADGLSLRSDEVIYKVQLQPRPVARIAVSIEGESVRIDGSGSASSEFDGAAISGFMWSFRSLVGNPSAEFGTSGEHGPTLKLAATDKEGEYLVSLNVTDELGRDDTATAMFGVSDGQPYVIDPIANEADWTEGATVYGVIVRNFGSGRFQSVIDRLDDLADLGVAALWFAPITETIPDYFGYEVIDYFKVRPEYGTLDDFKRLVDEAHARSLRVLMDLVPNHTSIGHPYFRHADRDGTASPYYDYYDRDESGAYSYYFDWTHLPNLNFDNPEVRRFMTEALMFWVRDMGVDGFRLDVAWGIKLRRPDYWLEFSSEFNRVRPDGLLIAEASARDPFYVNNGFDAAYDWTGELGIWAWGDVFAGVAPIGIGMQRALTNADGNGYDPDSFVFRFLNNNDTGSRFITTYGVDMYRVASAMLLTLPGLPCVYTGDEFGAEFEPYKAIGEIDWTDRHNLREHFRRLIRLRRELPGLRSRNWTPLALEPANQLFAYIRQNDADGSQVLVVLNFDSQDTAAIFDTTVFSEIFGGSTSLTDVYNDSLVEVKGGTHRARSIPVPGWGIRVLVMNE